MALWPGDDKKKMPANENYFRLKRKSAQSAAISEESPSHGDLYINLRTPCLCVPLNQSFFFSPIHIPKRAILQLLYFFAVSTHAGAHIFSPIFSTKRVRARIHYARVDADFSAR